MGDRRIAARERTGACLRDDNAGNAQNVPYARPFGDSLSPKGRRGSGDPRNLFYRELDDALQKLADQIVSGHLLRLPQEFNLPRAVTVDAAGNLFLTDIWNHRIREVVLSTGIITRGGRGEIGREVRGHRPSVGPLHRPALGNPRNPSGGL